MKKSRILILVLAIIMVISLFPVTAFAASASVSVSKSTMEVGDTVKVTFRFSATNIFGVKGTFSYDHSILQCVSSSSSGISTGGSIVLYASNPGGTSVSGSVTFKALKAGSAKISVSTSEFLDYDENNLGGASGSKTVTVVEKGSLPSPTPKPGTSPKPSPTPSFNAATQTVTTTLDTKTLYVWKDLTGVTLPTGFTSAKATLSGSEIQTAQNGSLVLAYTTDDKGANGAFYVLDAETGSLYPYIQITAGQAYTLLEPAANVTVPEGFTPKDLTLQDKTIQGWAAEDGQNPEFYLIYATSPKGQAGFYTYDTKEGTIQRYIERSIALPEPSPTAQPVQEITPPAPKGFFEALSANPAMMVVMIALAVLVLAAIPTIVVLAMKGKKKPIGAHEARDKNMF